MEKVIKFSGPDGVYGFLSNFYQSPFTYKDWECFTVEHAFQAAKTLIEEERQKVLNASSPREAKHLGRKVTLRNNWDLIKDHIMYEVCFAKFSQNKEIQEKLIDTGSSILVEHTPWKDYYWGDGGDGTGRNRLGLILMGIRSQLQQDNYIQEWKKTLESVHTFRDLYEEL